MAGWGHSNKKDTVALMRWWGAEQQVTGKGWQVQGSPLVWVFRRKSHYNVTVTEWVTVERSPWSIPQLAPYGSSQSHPLYSWRQNKVSHPWRAWEWHTDWQALSQTSLRSNARQKRESGRGRFTLLTGFSLKKGDSQNRFLGKKSSYQAVAILLLLYIKELAFQRLRSVW